MAPRGLSAAEKKVKMLEIFHETKEFYTLKEMEKLGPKLKGISESLRCFLPAFLPPISPYELIVVAQQTVKETLDDLVSDGLVMFDKIGTSNSGAAKQAAVDKASKELEVVRERIDQVKAGLKAAQRGREDTADRKNLLEALNTARETNAQLKYELAAYNIADPVKYQRKLRAIEVCKEAALRWTDNAVVAMQFGKTTYQMEDHTFRQITGIEDFDAWEDLQL